VPGCGLLSARGSDQLLNDWAFPSEPLLEQPGTCICCVRTGGLISSMLVHDIHDIPMFAQTPPFPPFCAGRVAHAAGSGDSMGWRERSGLLGMVLVAPTLLQWP
jgi:hypothetical protein